MKIGFIGVGWMGFGIANNILKNNHELFVIANKNRKQKKKKQKKLKRKNQNLKMK